MKRLLSYYLYVVVYAKIVNSMDFCLRCNKLLDDLEPCDINHPESILVCSDTFFDPKGTDDNNEFAMSDEKDRVLEPQIIVRPASVPLIDTHHSYSYLPVEYRQYFSSQMDTHHNFLEKIHQKSQFLLSPKEPTLESSPSLSQYSKITPEPLLNDEYDIELSNVEEKNTETSKIKRPKNSFFVFRTNYLKTHQREIKRLSAKEISVLTGSIWKKMSDNEKKPFIEESSRETRTFLDQHPDYRYAPKPKRPKLQSRHTDSSVLIKRKQIKE